MEIRRALKPTLVGVLVVLVLVLVVQNQEPVRTRFLLWAVEMPRFALLTFVYLLGGATGWILRWQAGRGG